MFHQANWERFPRQGSVRTNRQSWRWSVSVHSSIEGNKRRLLLTVAPETITAGEGARVEAQDLNL